MSRAYPRELHDDAAGRLIAEGWVDGAGVHSYFAYEYLYLDDGRPLGFVTDDGAGPVLYRYHGDDLGTPRYATDAAGAVVWAADLADPFALHVVGGGGLAPGLRFPGQYYQPETGLYYNYHRDYDPDTGRYLQPDPIGLAGGLNPYLYANANPLRFVDPHGLDAFTIAGTAQFFEGNAGGLVKGAFGFDTAGSVCFEFTTCARAGAGLSSGLSCGLEHNTSDFVEGDSASAGVFGNTGAGVIKSLSFSTSGDNVKTSATLGLGGGVAGGSQACVTRTFCARVAR